MKKCANCKHLYGRWGAWLGCELNDKEIKHPYLVGGKKCPCYEKYIKEKTKFEYPKNKKGE